MALPTASSVTLSAEGYRRGAPWDKLVNAASELGATLIVVGAHGHRGPMDSSLVGSVATRVVATSMQSVLVVRRKLG